MDFFSNFFSWIQLQKAAGYTKIFNLESNLVATACFALGQNIDYRIAFCMALGQLIGGKIGSHLAIRKGVKLIRPIFILVVSATIISFIYKNYLSSELLSLFSRHINLMQITLFSGLILIAAVMFIWNSYGKNRGLKG